MKRGVNDLARCAVSRVSDPVGARLVHWGLTPNLVTLLGTAGVVASAVVFFPNDLLFLGAMACTLCLLGDALDGAMARVGGKTSRFGAILDSSCDRVADGAVFGALAWWALVVADRESLGLAMLICLVAALVTSYVKAQARAQGSSADGGLVERTLRLAFVLVGAGLQGLGVSYVFEILAWVLVVLSVTTVAQRLLTAYTFAPVAAASADPTTSGTPGTPSTQGPHEAGVTQETWSVDQQS